LTPSDEIDPGVSVSLPLVFSVFQRSVFVLPMSLMMDVPINSSCLPRSLPMSPGNVTVGAECTGHAGSLSGCDDSAAASSASPPAEHPFLSWKSWKDDTDSDSDSEFEIGATDASKESELRKRRRTRRRIEKPSAKRLSRRVVKQLQRWMLAPEHYEHPYPTKEDLAELMDFTGLTAKQLTTWFSNARKRFWAPLRYRRGEPLPLTFKSIQRGVDGDGGSPVLRGRSWSSESVTSLQDAAERITTLNSGACSEKLERNK
jgi:hypothetical protein